MTDKAGKAEAQAEPTAAAEPALLKARSVSIQVCDDPDCGCTSTKIVLHDADGTPFAQGELAPDAAMRLGAELFNGGELQAARIAAKQAVRKH
jgi:hypothetical protein